MIKPTSLFPLPQDRLIKRVPKSTPQEFKAFRDKAIKAGVKL